jgi:VanZ family protein
MFTVMAVIFFLSHQPDIPLPQTVSFQDKILHLIAYGVLAATVLWAIHPVRSPAACFGVVVFCLLYGISDEFHQSFIPGRSPSIYDVYADVLGAVLVVAGHLLSKSGFMKKITDPS